MQEKVNHTLSDAELLKRYNHDGDARWLGMLLERYTMLLFGVCMKYLKDEHAAQDAVQQIFLKVLTDAGKYKIEYFKAWLYMVAKNHCLMQLRHKEVRYAGEINEETVKADDAGLQQAIDNEVAYEKLEEALAELSPEQGACITLFYLQKHSYQQVADKTGYNLNQVKSYIQNGKRNLRIILEKKLSKGHHE